MQFQREKGQGMSAEEQEKIARYENEYDPKTHLAGSARTSADYAVLLFQRGEKTDLERASKVIEAIIDLQINDPNARTHGQFPMRAGGNAGDLNAVLFIMPNLIQLLECGLAKMPEATAKKYEACVQHAIVGTERRWAEERFDLHRDFKGYTNIFLLYIQALLLAGNHYDDPRLQRQATAQWQRWFNHISYYGIDEFASPTYSNVDYEALKTIYEQSRDEQVQRESKYVLEHLSTLLHAVTHPILRLPVCGSSRNYRRFLTQDVCESQCVQEGVESPYTSDAVREDYQNRSFPYTVQGRATAIPFRYQSYQDKHVAMGTMTGGSYFWQQIHCMVAAGNSETERAVMFIPGAYTPTSGYVCQQDQTALCVFTRQPNTYHRTQAPMPDSEVHAFQRTFGIGITSNWTVAGENQDHMILSAYGYDVHIQPFEIRDGEARPISLSRVKQQDVGQGRFHSAPCDFDAFIFPEKAVQFGCLVAARNAGTSLDLPPIACTKQKETLTVQSDLGPSIQLYQQPAGDVTELYPEDWRTIPIFQNRIQTLYPGELSRRAANEN